MMTNVEVLSQRGCGDDEETVVEGEVVDVRLGRPGSAGT